jgi:hypothetical protein
MWLGQMGLAPCAFVSLLVKWQSFRLTENFTQLPWRFDDISQKKKVELCKEKYLNSDFNTYCHIWQIN